MSSQKECDRKTCLLTRPSQFWLPVGLDGCASGVVSPAPCGQHGDWELDLMHASPKRAHGNQVSCTKWGILLEKRAPSQQSVAQGWVPDWHLPPIPAHADMNSLRFFTKRQSTDN